MTRKLSPALFFGIILGVLLMAFSTIAYAERTFSVPTSQGVYQNFTFFTATTTTATSTNTTDGGGYFTITGAKSVGLYFGRGGTTGPNVGTTTFKIQVSDNGTNWYDYDQLQRVTSVTTGDTYFTRVANTSSGASVTNTGAATSTLLYKMDTLGWYAIRCIAVETTDGDHTCKASAEF